jgi:hypothetical protein
MNKSRSIPTDLKHVDPTYKIMPEATIISKFSKQAVFVI